MATIKDSNYITIFGWMRTKLGLKNTQLLVYAAIYGFTQDGVNEYTANLQWLADFIGVDRKSVQRAVNTLSKNGLIKRDDRNSKQGKTNTYTTIPLEEILEKQGGGQNVQGGRSICPGGSDKMSTLNLNDINNNIQEGKKEGIKKEITNNSNAGVDFSVMTDAELLDWWDTFNSKPFEPTTETFEMIDRYNAEVKRRGQGREGWKGKIIVNEHGAIERMKSYDEVIGEWGFNFVVVSKIFEFIKHCNANNHFVTNAKLNDLCYRLSDIPDDKARLLSLDTAIRKGYYDIRESSII